MRKLIRFAALTAAAVYFLHPKNGRRRRALLRNRVATLFAGARRRQAERPQPDDVTLAHQVESELFRDESVPKGQINVNAENGKIVLRGEVERPEVIVDLEKRARTVQGVDDVENLLHLPGAPAPMHQ